MFMLGMLCRVLGVECGSCFFRFLCVIVVWVCLLCFLCLIVVEMLSFCVVVGFVVMSRIRDNV